MEDRARTGLRKTALTVSMLIVIMSFLCMACRKQPAWAGEYDWAIPSGPLPDIPEPSDPTPVDGWDDDSNSTGSADVYEPSTSEPTQTQTPTAPQPSTTPTTEPQQSAQTQPSDNHTSDTSDLMNNVVFDRQKDALLQDFAIPATLAEDPSAAPTDKTPISTPNDELGVGPAPVGIAESEWKEAREAQRQLNEIYSKWPISAEDRALADKLETKRWRVWADGISTPGLTEDQRDRFRVGLKVLNAGLASHVPPLSGTQIDAWKKPLIPSVDGQGRPPAPTVNPVASWIIGQFGLGQAQNAIESGAEEFADALVGEENDFGDMLGVGKIALAYKDGGVSSAIAATADFIVGKIPLPTATIAVEGGRRYANVAFEAQNKFMTDAMAATGAEFDKERFWADFNEDCTAAQRAVKEWIGYGSN